MADFRQALGNTPASGSKAEVQRYVEWNAEFGSR
jgi:hypothetical protein